MNIQQFKWQELYNNSKGKTTLMLVCGHKLITAACILPFVHPDQTASALVFAGLGSALLGVRRFTKDKEIITPTNE